MYGQNNMFKEKGFYFAFIPVLAEFLILALSPDVVDYERNISSGTMYWYFILGLVIYLVSMYGMNWMVKNDKVSRFTLWNTLVFTLLMWYALSKFPFLMNPFTMWIDSRYNPYLPGLAFSYVAFSISCLIQQRPAKEGSKTVKSSITR